MCQYYYPRPSLSTPTLLHIHAAFLSQPLTHTNHWHSLLNVPPDCSVPSFNLSAKSSNYTQNIIPILLSLTTQYLPLYAAIVLLLLPMLSLCPVSIIPGKKRETTMKSPEASESHGWTKRWPDASHPRPSHFWDIDTESSDAWWLPDIQPEPRFNSSHSEARCLTHTHTSGEEISAIISEWHDWIRSHGEIKKKQSSRGEDENGRREPAWKKGSNDFASISFADPLPLGLDYVVIPPCQEKSLSAEPFLCAPPWTYALCF